MNEHPNILSKNLECFKGTIGQFYVLVHTSPPNESWIKFFHIISGEDNDPLSPSSRPNPIYKIQQTRESDLTIAFFFFFFLGHFTNRIFIFFILHFFLFLLSLTRKLKRAINVFNHYERLVELGRVCGLNCHKPKSSSIRKPNSPRNIIPSIADL